MSSLMSTKSLQSTMAGDHIGGMSRAAKKRAKKKQKEAQNKSGDSGASISKDDGTSSILKPVMDPKGEPLPKKQKLIKKEAEVEEDHESLEDIDESDQESSRDEAPIASEDITSPILTKTILPPKSVSTVQQILLEKDVTVPDELLEMTSKERANCAMNFLLQPSGVTTEEFYAKYWEKKPLLIQGSTKEHTERFGKLLSLKEIKAMTDKNTLYYGKDLNVTRYEKTADGVKRRKNLDLVSPKFSGDTEDFLAVDNELLWSHYNKGATIRLLCPHKQFDSVFSLLSLLELEFGCMVGANCYLTPPKRSQGFAPHYDDIEAFCLQVEGRKRWKVYKPLNKAEELPRVSSADYTEEDLKDCKPVIDTILEPGDLLYMPRGWIHQACTLPDGGDDKHSLHLTISAMQQWAWADFLDILLPEALESAANSETSTSLREGLPRCFLDYMGAVHDNDSDPDVLKAAFEARKDDADEKDPEEIRMEKVRELRETFRHEAKKRIMRVVREANDMIDAACDQIGKRFLSDRLPVALTNIEKVLTGKSGPKNRDILPATLCRLVRPGVARLVLEDGKAVVYHCLDNSRVYQENPLSPLEFEMDDAPAIEQLISTTEPRWIMVNDLIHDTIEDKVGVAQALYDEGILSIMDAE